MGGDKEQAARMTKRLAWCVLVVLVCCRTIPGFAQTLAHKGWAGSGLTVDPWWKGAVLYQLDPLTFADSNGDGTGDLNGITQRLDYLQGLGVDGIVLSPFQLQARGTGTAFEAVYGKEEDLDKLEQEASLRRMRIIVDLPLSAKYTAEDTLAMARFWLSRGVGGLRLIADSASRSAVGPAPGQADEAERVRQLRRLCAGYVGDRMLLWDVAGAAAPADVTHAVAGRGNRVGLTAAQLTVDHAAASLTAWNATTVRALVSGAVLPGAVLVSDTPDEARSWTRLSAGMDETERLAVAKMVATVLLAGREAPMIFYGQEIGMASPAAATSTPMQWGGEPGLTAGTPRVAMGPNAGTATVAAEDADPGSLLNWYRKLSALRQEGFALKGGSVTLVDTGYPDVVAWVRKGATSGERPVLVMCNLSGHGVLISVEQQLKQLGLKPTSGMMPMALSFTGINPSYTATGINLPPYGIYLGEILQPGLEDAPAPYVSHRRGR